MATAPNRHAAQRATNQPPKRTDHDEQSGGRKNDKATKERLQLERELLDAVTAPQFDPRDNFKPGQIIAHPKWGRGKIESVLRGSLLVRFLDGLRQVSRQ